MLAFGGVHQNVYLCANIVKYTTMKRFLSIIAVAATMFGAMASCGTRGEQVNRDNRPVCGGMGIGIDSATAEANTLPMPVTDLEHDRFDVAVPEGWKLLDNRPDGLNVYSGTLDEDFISGPYVSIEVIDVDGKTSADVIDEMVTGCNATKGDVIKIVNYHYRTCTYVEDGYDHQLLVRQQGDKLIKFDIINTDANNPEVRSIINTLELK